MTPVPPDDSSRSLEQEIRAGRLFSLGDAIGKEAGAFMRGESPMPRLTRAIAQILHFLDLHVVDSSGALLATLKTWVKTNDTQISRYLDSPLTALAVLLERLLHNQALFYDFARQVTMTWGEMNGERPRFQQPGQPPHPDQVYCHADLQAALAELLHRVTRAIAPA